MVVPRLAIYAIIALQEMETADKPVPMARLSEILTAASGDQVSMGYVQQVMLGLLNAGIVSSVRGPTGGYVLAKKLDKVSVFEVINVTSRAKPRETPPARTLEQTVANKIENRVEMALKKLKVKDLKINVKSLATQAKA